MQLRYPKRRERQWGRTVAHTTPNYLGSSPTVEERKVVGDVESALLLVSFFAYYGIVETLRTLDSAYSRKKPFRKVKA